MGRTTKYSAPIHRYLLGYKSRKTAEDASLLELEIPVTTDPTDISDALQKTDEKSMKVVFCTYHSLPIVEAAQDAERLRLMLSSVMKHTEPLALRTTADKTSPFVLVHDTDRIRAKKRLYMTATSRLYTEGAKAKAARHDIEVFSMDDPEPTVPNFTDSRSPEPLNKTSSLTTRLSCLRCPSKTRTRHYRRIGHQAGVRLTLTTQPKSLGAGVPYRIPKGNLLMTRRYNR